MSAPERVACEKATTGGGDSRGMRSWLSYTPARHYWVRHGHKGRRQWERREVEREMRGDRE